MNERAGTSGKAGQDQAGDNGNSAKFGALGALAGWAVGGIVFGIGAAVMAFRVTGSLDMAAARDAGPAIARPVVSPFSSGKSHIN